MTYENKNANAKQNTPAMVNELERTVTAEELADPKNEVIGAEKGASEEKDEDCGTCRPGL
ncbi:hypothetical protein AM501_09260 [Aneurinibacillus migulanus]|uniref:Uncharacterized protein n=2 Tax=Aneurinibacillus migulanus TaxID=47500 RepID=A0A0D1VKQ4_ANEMI|nr:hypothetical protein [Aneurinibacillus migulanus]KIV56821.1 hypothetical protein TS64_08620 [Aneurinibacillus migulanus]KIV60104.1 hypothetical protein TS65_01435 [Aneurinibacillus migulanus]KON96779.1 hypothetical protein AF333_16150 [Aneurinibacillus migulanus]KPD08586.1 hypothetical protein AM501_09260 [Aneurinibacillus migulanus]MED0893547.1 hypothetical protein [Aneurinibacillus migulanus]